LPQAIMVVGFAVTIQGVSCPTPRGTMTPVVPIGRTSPGGTAVVPDRRRSTRIELLDRLHGHSVSLDVPVAVVDLSLGGMAIETTTPLRVGAIHLFRLTLGDDSTTELAGRVMHSRNTAPDGATPIWAAGLQFVDVDAEDTAVGLIDKVL
jgi:hypothetical protein